MRGAGAAAVLIAALMMSSACGDAGAGGDAAADDTAASGPQPTFSGSVGRGDTAAVPPESLHGDATFWVSERQGRARFQLNVDTRSGGRVSITRPDGRRPAIGSYAIGTADTAFALRYAPQVGGQRVLHGIEGTLTITDSNAQRLAGSIDARAAALDGATADTVRLTAEFAALCGAESSGDRCE